jgi:hypothetical protein
LLSGLIWVRHENNAVRNRRQDFCCVALSGA